MNPRTLHPKNRKYRDTELGAIVHKKANVLLIDIHDYLLMVNTIFFAVNPRNLLPPWQNIRWGIFYTTVRPFLVLFSFLSRKPFRERNV